MRLKSFIQFLSIGLFAVMVLSIISCGGCDQATEEDSAAQDPVVETTPTVPPPPPVVRKRAEVKKKRKAEPETPEEFVAIEDDEVETIDNVKFVPHRFTYEELETEDQPLSVSMKAFDDPPIYGKQCLKKDNPDECSQMEIQHYFSENMNFPNEAKGMDDPVEYVSFLVKADGQIDKDNIQILKQDPQCRECAAEALTLIQEMPKWQPAMKGGTPVAVRVTVPVRFYVK
jgi:Gram-negative bacterial TonB protein C-terminal